MTDLCKNYIRGNCKRSNCRFQHVDHVCFQFFFKGKCKQGDACKKSHQYCCVKVKEVSDFRLLVVDGWEKEYMDTLEVKDVIVIPNLFEEHFYKSLTENETHLMTIVNRIASFFKMSAKEDPNFMCCVSFGATQNIIFENVATKTKVSIALCDGFAYCFSKEISMEWKVSQSFPTLDQNDKDIFYKVVKGKDSISVIVSGWIEN
jgi:hypothetical protein